MNINTEKTATEEAVPVQKLKKKIQLKAKLHNCDHINVKHDLWIFQT